MILVNHSNKCTYCQWAGHHSPVDSHFPGGNPKDHPSHLRTAPHRAALTRPPPFSASNSCNRTRRPPAASRAACASTSHCGGSAVWSVCASSVPAPCSRRWQSEARRAGDAPWLPQQRWLEFGRLTCSTSGPRRASAFRTSRGRTLVAGAFGGASAGANCACGAVDRDRYGSCVQ